MLASDSQVNTDFSMHTYEDTRHATFGQLTVISKSGNLNAYPAPTIMQRNFLPGSGDVIVNNAAD